MRTAILGAGYAGMAAAMALARAGHPVDVFEAGPVPGGRARRIEVDGLWLDNGQHMAIGAYADLLGLMAEAGVDLEQAFLRLPLELAIYDGPQQTMRLACPRLPAPLHTLAGLLGASGLSWAERAAAIGAMSRARLAGWQLAQDCSVASWLATHGQSPKLVQCLWEPLTLAALNTPIATASAQVLLNVLRDSLAAGRAASDFLLPRQDLSAVFPEAAASYLQARGGRLHTGQMVRSLQQRDGQWHIDRSAHAFDAVICALPPHRLAMLAEHCPALQPAAQQLAHWDWQPIYTVYLRYPAGTRLSKPMLGLINTLAQWVFDRGQICGQDGLMAAVISAGGPHENLTQAELAEWVAAELARCQPALPAPLWQRVIAEKRATFSCTAGLARPANGTAEPGLWLAGDYTAGDYPATLEGAVRSGLQAAHGLLHSRA